MKLFNPFLRNTMAAVFIITAIAIAFWWRNDLLRTKHLDRILKKNRLVVLTRNASTTYYQGPQGPAGFEYDLVKDFADHLGVELEIKIIDSISDILPAINRGDGDIAAAGLTRTDLREDKFLFGPDYHVVQQQVIYRRNNKKPAKNPAELAGKDLLIIEHSSYEERLNELRQEIPDLNWNTTRDLSTEQILEKVWKEELKYTVADSNIFAINRRYFPELSMAFPITEEQPLAWIIRPNAFGLQAEIEKWIDDYEQSGRLAQLRERYYAFTEIFDFVDLAVYHRRIDKGLPRYKELFQEAAEKTDLPWDLLAAQAYQESHWNPKAKSPTGVRGIMMLTLATAKAVGVHNRLDPAQSIHGGAEYLARIMKRVPSSVTGEDHLKFGLAAYNVGMGHMLDAQVLATRLGKNPDAWNDLKTVLPLLSQKKYYKTVRHGYARGSEPVLYVERVFNYRDILRQKINSETARMAQAQEYHDEKALKVLRPAER